MSKRISIAKKKQVVALLKNEVDPSRIADIMELSYASVHWIAQQNGLKCTRMYYKSGPKEEGRWVNLEARQDGSGYY